MIAPFTKPTAIKFEESATHNDEAGMGLLFGDVLNDFKHIGLP